MRKILLLIICLLTYNITIAQIGIGTNVPKTTLDVTGVPSNPSIADGFIGPRLTGNELTAKNSQYTDKQNGTIVHVRQGVSASTTTGKTRNVNTIGYYFYDSTADDGLGLWIPFAGKKKQIYIPTMLLPTDQYVLPSTSNYSYANGVFSVDLYSIYKNQIETPLASTSSLPLDYASNAVDYHYFILYYDTSVFKNVSVSTSGVLNYTLISGYFVTEKTFMNIVILEK